MSKTADDLSDPKNENPVLRETPRESMRTELYGQIESYFDPRDVDTAMQMAYAAADLVVALDRFERAIRLHSRGESLFPSVILQARDARTRFAAVVKGEI